jgi:hypothetical protein
LGITAADQAGPGSSFGACRLGCGAAGDVPHDRVAGQPAQFGRRDRVNF